MALIKDPGLMQDYEILLQTDGTVYNQVAADKNLHEKGIVTPFFYPHKVEFIYETKVCYGRLSEHFPS